MLALAAKSVPVIPVIAIDIVSPVTVVSIPPPPIIPKVSPKAICVTVEELSVIDIGWNVFVGDVKFLFVNTSVPANVETDEPAFSIVLSAKSIVLFVRVVVDVAVTTVASTERVKLLPTKFSPIPVPPITLRNKLLSIILPSPIAV